MASKKTEKRRKYQRKKDIAVAKEIVEKLLNPEQKDKRGRKKKIVKLLEKLPDSIFPPQNIVATIHVKNHIIAISSKDPSLHKLYEFGKPIKLDPINESSSICCVCGKLGKCWKKMEYGERKRICGSLKCYSTL
ncbi:hypothetical protein ADUPG1_008616 [Aduncisulcus paluster]|uniref:Uncharacterized protein n=1 Tax=Aduncisulcus paluster TaxID=2918883 RepID=A0ABQ5KUY3_9EUKA|nr:hypothetical protein ADUPG1_008616 [Aduncisulcus paluster]